MVLVALLLGATQAQAQVGTVVGRILDSATRQPLSGVQVNIGDRGSLSQSSGNFIIVGVPAGTQTLEARMIGYATVSQEVTVTSGQTTTVDFEMTVEAVGLSEIVVTAYGQQRAGNITGSVKQVSPTEFNKGRIVSPEELLTSKVSGVQIVDNNEPGGSTSVRIRGATSINASSDPLYVIDGMPMGGGAGGGLSAGRNPLNFINPNDIESITVLKDASSAAMYGSNAANGVIIITTKSGRAAPELEYTGSISASAITRLPDMLDAGQFRSAVQAYAPQNVGQLGSANTDWYNEVDRTGVGQEHNISLSGSGTTMDYRVSVGYLDQRGVIEGTRLQRLSFGAAYDQRFFDDNLDVEVNVKASRAEDLFTPGGVVSNAAQMGPTQPLMDPTNPTGFYEWPGNTLQSADNPLAILALASDEGRTDRSVGNIQAEYDMPFISALKAHVNLGYDLTSAQRQTFSPRALHSELKAGRGGNVYRRNPSQLNTVMETYLNYAAPLNAIPGWIDLTGGYSYTESHAEYPWFEASGLSTDLLGVYGVPGSQTSSNQQDIQESRLISFFGRLNYNLDDKYLLGVSVRRDGSSRFGPGNEWGMFPAASVAWRISEESFFQDNTPFSDLKLRASWGKTGNQSFDNYQQYSTYLVGNDQAQVQFGNDFITTIRPSAADPNIKWEETRSWDVGSTGASAVRSTTTSRTRRT
jgi:iron complex outermembrane receptor protein